MVGPEPAEGLGLLHHEGGQKHADLVAVERRPLAAGIAGERNAHSDPVGVGVAGEHQIGGRGPGFGDRGLERPGILGVGDVAGHVGEVAVGRALRGQDVHSLEPALRSAAATEVSPTPWSGV